MYNYGHDKYGSSNGEAPYLPTDMTFDQEKHDYNNDNTLHSYGFLLKLIDPMIYVMQFSSFSDEKLQSIITNNDLFYP